MSQHPDLPYEQAKNTEYLARLRAKTSLTSGIGVARSRRWVDPTSIRAPHGVAIHPLVGRIGFDVADEHLGRSCYIGPARLDDGDLQVVSWDAPVARLFYDTGDAGFRVDGELAVRRTFDHRLNDIADVDDEWIQHLEPSPLAPPELQVPAPAHTPRRRRVEPNQADSSLEPEQNTDELGASNGAPATPDAPAAAADTQVGNAKRSARPNPASSPLPDMRAAQTVLKKLAAPRSDALKSVLATLQPDQFDVVSREPACDLIVQGHPGTGKTVVAAYRAAYLVSPERKEAQAPSVLFVGPTKEYVAHVSGLLRPLDPNGRVVITHIADVLDRTVELKSQWSGGIGGGHNDLDPRARQFAARAEKMLKEAHAVSSGPTARRDHIKAIYELMRSNGTPEHPLSSDPGEAKWLRGLLQFDQAIRLRRYLPLIAQVALSFQPVPFTDQFTHLLVDESQDISPIEWNVLEQFLRPGGHWTLVGDMNQRRSDTTYASWAQISDHLGLGDGDDTLRATVLRRGYRSTTPILQFADKLLPAAARGATSIQEAGPEPHVQYVAAVTSLFPQAIDTAQKMMKTYPGGTVAIITVDPGPLLQLLGKQGWRRGETLNVWERNSEVLRVFVPEMARGLEFDAVVVVEPGAFPENLGREGQLYTSLTRANRELAVVWHRDLPDPLRKAGRR